MTDGRRDEPWQHDLCFAYSLLAVCRREGGERDSILQQPSKDNIVVVVVAVVVDQ